MMVRRIGPGERGLVYWVGDVGSRFVQWKCHAADDTADNVFGVYYISGSWYAMSTTFLVHLP